MKRKLIYACPWGGDKQKSWSGTHWHLREALLNYFDIIDIDTGMRSISSISIFAYKAVKKICFKLKVDMKLRLFLQDKAVMSLYHNIENGDAPILQFGSANIQKGKKQYCFIDLHYGWVKKMYENDLTTFENSNYAHMTYSQICNEEKKQAEFFKNCSGIFTMGKWVEKEITHEYGLSENRVHAVGGGINIEPSKIDASLKSRNKILFVGRDFERKNGPLVIEAFRRLKKVRPDLELYIAGGYKIDEPNIYCIGDVNADEMSYYYNLCDVFVMPSIFEAYGLVFAEALAYGLPCIGFDNYEMPYFIKDGINGRLLKKNDADELMKLMDDIMGNDSYFDNVKKMKATYLKEYSWDSVASKIYTIVGEL